MHETAHMGFEARRQYWVLISSATFSTRLFILFQKQNNLANDMMVLAKDYLRRCLTKAIKPALQMGIHHFR